MGKKKRLFNNQRLEGTILKASNFKQYEYINKQRDEKNRWRAVLSIWAKEAEKKGQNTLNIYICVLSIIRDLKS